MSGEGINIHDFNRFEERYTTPQSKECNFYDEAHADGHGFLWHPPPKRDHMLSSPRESLSITQEERLKAHLLFTRVRENAASAVKLKKDFRHVAQESEQGIPSL